MELKDELPADCKDDVASADVSHAVILLSNDANDERELLSLTLKTPDAKVKGLGLLLVLSKICITPTLGMIVYNN